ncbi:MAG: hypothetical protein IID31_10960 [Planctomycetes bacterium]|nr:hypothetical protein [Planctomycetota bacterium]
MEKPRTDTDSGDSVSSDEEPFEGHSVPETEKRWESKDIYIGWTPNGLLKVGRHFYYGWFHFVGTVLAFAVVLALGLFLIGLIYSCQGDDYWLILDPPKYEHRR